MMFFDFNKIFNTFNVDIMQIMYNVDKYRYNLYLYKKKKFLLHKKNYYE